MAPCAYEKHPYSSQLRIYTIHDVYMVIVLLQEVNNMKSVTEFESWSALVTELGMLELGIQKNLCPLE